MHPCPIGRGLSLYSNLFVIDKTRSTPLPEGNLWLQVWVSQSAKGSIQLGGDRAIGYGTVSPTVDGLPRVKKNSLLLDVIKEKVDEVHED